MSVYCELVFAVFAYNGVTLLFSLKKLGSPALGAFPGQMEKRGQGSDDM